MTTVSFRTSTLPVDGTYELKLAIDIKAMLGKLHWAAKKGFCNVARWEMASATVEIFQFKNGYVRVSHSNDMMLTKVETHKRFQPTTYLACFADTIVCKNAEVADPYVKA